jgi:hypothetical protein
VPILLRSANPAARLSPQRVRAAVLVFCSNAGCRDAAALDAESALSEA